MPDPQEQDCTTIRTRPETPSGSSNAGPDLEALARYSANRSGLVIRPGWHRIAGWLGIGLGLIIMTLNDAMRLGDDLRLLPYGHTEVYLLLGIAVAGASTWFLGMFDRQTGYR